MPTYLLDLECDGTAFFGTQVQARERTVQAVLAEVLTQLNNATIGVRLVSRLDQGVSARSLPASCRLERIWDPVVLGLAINQHLPHDLAVTRVAIMGDDFDALGAPCTKHYRYTVRERAVMPVLDRRCWWVRSLPRRDLLPDLAMQIPGRRDLSGFATLRHDGKDDRDPQREYLAAAWRTITDDDGLRHDFTISGRGFLYKQIRGLVGAMIHIAQGRVDPVGFALAIASGRQAVRLGNIAPAEGLCLMAVDLDAQPGWRRVTADRPG